MRSLVEQARLDLAKLRADRDKILKKIDSTYKKRLAQHRTDAEKELRGIEETFAKDQEQAKRPGTPIDVRLIESEHVQQREDNHHWHTQVWTDLCATGRRRAISSLKSAERSPGTRSNGSRRGRSR